MRNTALIFAACCLSFVFVLFTTVAFVLPLRSTPPPVKNVEAPQASIPAEFENFRDARKLLPSSTEEVSLVAAGDIMLSRDVAAKIKKYNDVNYPFLKTRDYTSSADIAFANLETPITPSRPIGTGELTFRSDPGVEKGLKDAGFSIVSLANNHTLNFGTKGLQDTFSYLDKVGIKYVGAGNNLDEALTPKYIEIKGITFGFLAFNDTDTVPDSYGAMANRAGTAFMDIERMRTAVQKAGNQADIVIVSMHAGKEYTAVPNTRQTEFAHAAIDAGADMVIGHHPHVVQTVEKYHDRYIIYSLGNFIFDQMWSHETREGMTLKAMFTKNGLQSITFSPVVIDDYVQPHTVEGSQAESILTRLDILLTDSARVQWDAAQQIFVSRNERNTIFAEPAVTLSNTTREIVQDANGDGKNETYSLTDGKLTITEDGATLWQSDPAWWVDDFALADANGDGKTDITMSVWKSGNFGSAHPFWDASNDQSVKNHFFVFGFHGGKVVPIWQSSNLDAPNCRYLFGDVDGDGKQELVTIEGKYSPDLSCTGKYLAVWKWNDWGFTNIWRSGEAAYHSVALDTFSNSATITAQ